MFKIATWNVNSINVRLSQVIDWLRQHDPDVLCLQETKCECEKFPTDALKALGYHSICNGQKAYNGVAIISKTPLRDVLHDVPTITDPQRRILVGTIGKVRIINLYVPNGESLTSPKFEYKLSWLSKITAFINEELNKYEKLVVVGDFNIAPQPEDVYDPVKWQNRILFSEKERLSLKNLCDLGLSDAFRLFEQPQASYTWWDYRTYNFNRNLGLRIDHIIVSKEMAKLCTGCSIDADIRQNERPSDHVPVVASFIIDS